MNRLVRFANAFRRAVARGVFPHQFSWILELGWRRLILSPERHAARLELDPDATVLEVGAGSGYYSVAVAARVPAGRLEIADLQPEMLRKCRKKCESARVSNVSFTSVDAARLPFRASTFDVVYMVTVFGEVRHQRSCLAEIRRVLTPQGALYVSEHLPDPDFTSLGSLTAQAAAFGFRLERRFGNRAAYTALLRVDVERPGLN